jgi:hypothetical protein
MAPIIYFSYARANNDAYLRRFVQDLCEEVRALVGASRDAQIGFFDQQDIELGEDWKATVADALATAQTVVAILSPAYFKSAFCGKELAVFQQRASQAPRGRPALLPIVWMPWRPEETPEAVKPLQLQLGDPGAAYNTKGLRSLLKQVSLYEVTYVDFLQSVAQDIVDRAREPLPPLATVPALSQVRSLFERHVPDVTPKLAASRPPEVLPKHEKRRLFICYRREDTIGIVGRIYDRLVRDLGEDSVFKDVDNIPFGADFVDYIEQEIHRCHVLLAVIGPRWFGDAGDGTPRLNDPNDFVRIEIAAALRRAIIVVPLLVDGAKMPKHDQLPDDLKQLTRRNGTVVRHDPDFHPDVTRLLSRLSPATEPQLE